MFKKTKAQTIKEYMVSLPEERKKDILFLDDLIKKTGSKLKPHFAYNMLGYGSFKYKNYKNEVIDWPIISLASQKNYISLYVCCVMNGKYIAEQNKADLGKVSVGKSCIRFKKAKDLNIAALKKIIKLAAKNPGFEIKNK
jgi:hypothetical protein